jgi:sec-independent protein translocase protein TatA
MFGLGIPELLLVLLLGLFLFGHKMPSLARSLGRSLTELKRGAQSVTDEVQSTLRT